MTTRVVHIDAQPDRLSFDTAKTAVIVCDMHHDFGAERAFGNPSSTDA